MRQRKEGAKPHIASIIDHYMGAHDLSMFSSQDIILFDLPGSKTLSTTRKLHIRRLYDVLQLCLLRDDLVRARKAWAILVRCKEVHWKALWKTGILLLDEFEYEFDQDRETAKRIDYLSTMMLQQSEDVRIHHMVTAPFLP